MRTLLVTGGLGFIGSNLVHHLAGVSPDSEIRVLDDGSMGSPQDIAGTGARLTLGDIRDRARLEEAMRGADAIVHLAADTRVMDSIADPTKNFEVNVLGSFNVLDLARRLGVPRVVAASTGGAIIGERPPPYHEELAPRPIAPYGASKLAMEGYASAFGGAYGMTCVCLRFSNVYGPRSYNKASAVAKFFKQIINGETLTIFGDGSQRRDFVYVSDIVQAICRALRAEVPASVYQLGAGYSTDLNSLLSHMRRIVGPEHTFKVEYEDFRVGEVRDTTCLIDLVRSRLGYEPEVDLEEGLRRTWAWFQQHYGVGRQAAE